MNYIKYRPDNWTLRFICPITSALRIVCFDETKRLTLIVFIYQKRNRFNEITS